MAVSVIDTLPAQPTAGTSTYRPLGGDGWSAPHAMYMVLQQLTGDATGGNSTTSLFLDDRFMNVVSLIEIHVTGAGSVREAELQLRSARPSASLFRVRAFGQMLFLSSIGNQQLMTWNPPLLPGAESVVTVTINVDTAVVNIRAIVYCFQKRALEKVPLNILLAALPSTQFVNVNVG